MPSKKKAPKLDDAFVDYPVTDEDLFLEPIEPEAGQFKWFLYLAIAIFCAGLAVNVCQMAIDYTVTAYQSEKFMRWQEDQIKQYEQEHPGSHPHTKDYPGDTNL